MLEFILFQDSTKEPGSRLQPLVTNSYKCSDLCRIGHRSVRLDSGTVTLSKGKPVTGFSPHQLPTLL